MVAEDLQRLTFVVTFDGLTPIGVIPESPQHYELFLTPQLDTLSQRRLMPAGGYKAGE